MGNIRGVLIVIGFTKSKTAFDRNIIKLFEKNNGFKLPKEYIKFLEAYNGGRPEANIVELKGCEIESFSISTFFGTNLDNYNDIVYQFNILNKRIPKECVPIADVEGGNVICMNLSAEKRGYIYLWDHEVELLYGEAITIDNMCFIAESFTSFLSMIEPHSPTTEELREYKVLNVWVNPDFMEKIKQGQ